MSNLIVLLVSCLLFGVGLFALYNHFVLYMIDFPASIFFFGLFLSGEIHSVELQKLTEVEK